ncbi:MAG: D-tyrosyl-tRNA(Tyr) deacylase [Chloroflexi bacterium]|nr:MAG: D-tyrosyl-tRNA(Tyr) deacylase [Chloroflexota bacterium]
MRTVVQRVASASVRWDGGEASIGRGYCLLVGVADTDEDRDADYLADKLLKLRVFSDEAGKFNLSATQVNASFLVVSQFTLFADARGQNRPSFLHAARPEQSRPLLERFIARLRASGLAVETGSFGAQMAVELVNDGPVTISVDS